MRRVVRKASRSADFEARPATYDSAIQCGYSGRRVASGMQKAGFRMVIFTNPSMFMPQFISRTGRWRVCSAALLLCVAVAAFAQGQSQGKTPQSRSKNLSKLPLTKFYDTPTAPGSGKPGELMRSESFDDYLLPPGISAKRILYYSRSAGGDLVATSGVVLFPAGRAPSGGWPVIASAHALNGVARTCAPSLSRNLVDGPFLAMYVNLGYAVVATDYTGLGTNFPNAFADEQSNAWNVIDSIPAARSAVPQLGPRWIAMGIGEGARAGAERSRT